MEAIPMSKVLDDVLAANQSYVEGFGDKGSLALPPARRFAILTCMDSCGPLGVLRKVI
jgi:carbonic anhydrase